MPIVDRVKVTDETMFAYLDKLPRAQWSAADVLLYVDFPIDRERSRRVAKAWLRRAIVAAPRRYPSTLGFGALADFSG